MKITALALISGGLDSLLAAKLIYDQGCEVIGLHFRIPFCKINIQKSFPDIGIKIIEVDLGPEFLKVIHSPHYGFGSNMNPCIDCKILMFSKARELMPGLGARFIVSGEVLGQRPMSQTKQALKIIREKSGLKDLLLRPLSAQFFAPSLAEKEGWVKREKLLNFNGRIRTPQMRLAKELGFKDYSNPAGGCLLTDPCFSKRLLELMAHDELSLENLELLKVGRHFRLGKHVRLVVGRDQEENACLMRLARSGDYLFSPQRDLAGPTALARGVLDQESILLSSQIISAYTDTAGLNRIGVFFRQIPSVQDKVNEVVPLPKERFAHLFI